MNRTIKVFATAPEQERLAASYPVVERYEGFVVLEVPSDRLTELARRYPVEDITEQYRIRIGDKELDTSQPRIDAKGKERAHPAYRNAKRLSPGPHHYLVQFIGPIKDEWLAGVKRAGGEPRAPFGGFTYVVRADETARAAIASLPFVRWVGHLPPEDRIAPLLAAKVLREGEPRELPRTRKLNDTYTVEFFGPKDVRAGVAAIRKLGYRVLSQDRDAALVVVRDLGAKEEASRLQELAAVHGVRAIRERSLKRPSNDVAAGVMGTQACMASPGLALSGAGEVIGICDTGLDTGNASTVHRDFAGRVDALLSYPITPDLSAYVTNPKADDGPADLDSGHGTHVAGSVLGDGSASVGLAGVVGRVRGLSHGARLVFQAVEQEMKWRDPDDQERYGRYLLAGIPNDLQTLFTDAYGHGVRVHSNSWGGGDPGAYDAQCEQLDRFIWEHKDFCVLFANGNDGTDEDGDGRINAKSVTSPATAKNCISVGACENLRPTFNADTYGEWWPNDYPQAPYHNDPMANNAEQVAAFSSRGPTSDGRIKPDIVAPGTFILLTRSTMIAGNNMGWAGFVPSRMYFHMGGTSMATPLTAGAVGLIREYLRAHRQIQDPTAALLKAALIAGATRLPLGSTIVADNERGFGRVNLDAILSPVAPISSDFIEQAPGLRTGEVYTKTVAVASRQAPLRVVLAYSDFPGPSLVNNLNLILLSPDGSRFLGNQLTGGLTMDAQNNVEVVHVDNPTPGEWTLQVVASNVPNGPQDFALVVLGHLGQASASGDTVELETSPALSIPDNAPAGVSSVLEITRSGRVSGLQITVDIRHTFIGDLRVWITGPDQQQVALHDRAGGGADDIHRTYDVGNTPALSRLIGIDAAGKWRLTVVDQAAVDVGKLDHWELSLTLSDADPFQAHREPALQIPDADPTGVQDALTLAGVGSVREIQVSLDIAHTWIGDLRVTLKSPSGRELVLHDRSGSSADNIVGTFTQASLPVLAAFAGEATAGQWVLTVADLAGRDVGKLNRWGIRIVT